MAIERPAQSQPADADIKQVPQDADFRERIRAVAEELARDLGRDTVPPREELTELGGTVLDRLGLGAQYLGFAMVAVSNGFWREQYEAVPFHRRLLLLPKCLRDPELCRAEFDSVGLHCAGCGACIIHDLSQRARELGYEVIVAEGTSSVIMKVLEGEADAILGVACLDSLDESFEPVADLGVPNQAIPLLRDGCVRTETEPALIVKLMTASRDATDAATRSAVPLLRVTRRAFAEEALRETLASVVREAALAATPDSADPTLATEAIALDWLRCGGKRLRPFVTVAAWALGRHGVDALAPDAPVERLVTAPVRALAVAIEALHKASLAHDDIADDDTHRYGREALHRAHGVGAAVNVGDWLVGLGYRLIAAQSDALGHRCVADILDRLARAQLTLCRGQGTELAWTGGRAGVLRPVDALQMGALKTAPAFEVALYAGLRASEADFDEEHISRFSTFLGEAYQVLNDLDDWREDSSNKVALGRDVLARRPTILRAFALEAGGGERLAEIARESDPERIVAAARAVYFELGVFDRARALVDGLRERCLELAEQARPEAAGELLRFLVRAVLRERPEPRTGGA